MLRAGSYGNIVLHVHCEVLHVHSLVWYFIKSGTCQVLLHCFCLESWYVCMSLLLSILITSDMKFMYNNWLTSSAAF